MNKQLPSLITIRVTAKDGTEGRISVPQAKFAAAWAAAQASAPKGGKVEALVAEVYL